MLSGEITGTGFAGSEFIEWILCKPEKTKLTMDDSCLPVQVW